MKCGIAFEAYGRKYDHALVQFKFKIRLRCERKSARKDFSALKSPTIQRAHESCIEESFRSNPRPSSPCDQWGRLTNTLQKAQSTLPSKRELGTKKWETSEETLQLVKQRSQNWSRIDNDEKKSLTKAISRSARNDHRQYVESILHDIEKENLAGNTTEIYRLSRSLATKRNGN